MLIIIWYSEGIYPKLLFHFTRAWDFRPEPSSVVIHLDSSFKETPLIWLTSSAFFDETQADKVLT